ncbi:protein BREAST CANCER SUSCEPTIBILITY 1 homolog [Silene latifolia]|uniref:protein BREAST CANCER SUSCEPTIBILITY 1 homolog n=1 Tax=Silene latifolia TaxID=37657 RepID=UPI003D77E9D4
MANISYLEKLCRELNCPICLSLLESAVSLTCNHVFCNSCIYKSMKSGSNCPVCKVPFQRREVRPAPHMDNLVNIYKSMEVASGIPLPAQDESTSKLDALRKTDGDLNPIKGSTDEEVPLTKSHHQKGETSKRSKSKAKNSARSRGKSSFSMNKRIQVPESPSTDTPLRQAKEELEKNQRSKKVVNKIVRPPSEQPLSIGNESAGLAPFFWLRDDDAEKSSQHTDEYQLTCTPANIPSFSDIKDSDDDLPAKISPKAPIRKCVNVELFDSEMFEWTQRPCSPELCLSPSKMQVEDQDACDGMLENGLELPSTAADIDQEVTAKQLDNISPHEKSDKFKPNSWHGSIDHSQNESKNPQKRGTKGSKRNQNKRQKINVDKHSKTDGGSNSTNGDTEQGQKSKNNSAHGSSKAVGVSKSRSFQSPDILLSDNADGVDVSNLYAFLEGERGPSELNTFDIARGNSKRIKKSHQSDLVKTSRQKQKLSKADINGEVIASQDKRSGVSTSKSNSLHEKSVGEPSSFSERSSLKTKRSIEQVKSKIEETTGTKNNLQEKMADATKSVLMKTGKGHLDTDMPTLRKCNASSTQCAFCLKTEETKASGEMLHYVQGKRVPASHSGETVIHSHKNCTEWAPNVYFEGDIAVNLEEELARSRRIKCSLCGMKGAALGCYEKSCRKSFHVPCAKKLRECRWDTEHFVILCSLHVSSKLPCEMSISQVPQVKSGKYNVNGKLLHEQPQISVKCSNSRWSCGRSSEKLVLCGSALSTEEKEAVSELAKSSGVALSANWNPTVTHVIASTIENGACKRTFKVLKGILEGKWILSIKWVQACMKASKLVEETPYEITCDIYGIQNGPYLGRLRLLNKEPKLFSGFKFYLTGDFEPSYMRYLQDLATTAGGTILHRKPIAEDTEISASCSSVTSTLIIYAELADKCQPSRKHLTLERRRSDAEALASSSGARVAHDTWLFHCIAGHKLLDL